MVERSGSPGWLKLKVERITIVKWTEPKAKAVCPVPGCSTGATRRDLTFEADPEAARVPSAVWDPAGAGLRHACPSLRHPPLDAAAVPAVRPRGRAYPTPV